MKQRSFSWVYPRYWVINEPIIFSNLTHRTHLASGYQFVLQYVVWIQIIGLTKSWMWTMYCMNTLLKVSTESRDIKKLDNFTKMNSLKISKAMTLCKKMSLEQIRTVPQSLMVYTAKNTVKFSLTSPSCLAMQASKDTCKLEVLSKFTFKWRRKKISWFAPWCDPLQWLF